MVRTAGGRALRVGNVASVTRPSSVTTAKWAPDSPRILASTPAVYGKLACPRVSMTPFRRATISCSLRPAASAAAARVMAVTAAA